MLSKNEMMYGTQGTMRYLMAQSEAVSNEIALRLAMRRIKRLKKEIANNKAIIAYTRQQLRPMRRWDDDKDSMHIRTAAVRKLNYIKHEYSTTHLEHELSMLVESIG